MTPAETIITNELKELKSLFARLIGTADRPEGERFSTAALDSAAKVYQHMEIERGDWVHENDLQRYLGPCPYNAGTFIRSAFDFSNWIKRGRSYLYNKQDLIALGQQLKDRNINLKRYQEFLDDKVAFDKKAAQKLAAVAKSAAAPAKSHGASQSATGTATSAATGSGQTSRSQRKPFTLPKGVKNITTTDIPKPDPGRVRQDLAELKATFKAGNFAPYIDIYKGTHAMLKHIYIFQKYLEPGLKRRCQRWCEDFNYANHALESITGKKEKFTATDQAAGDPTAIEL